MEGEYKRQSELFPSPERLEKVCFLLICWMFAAYENCLHKLWSIQLLGKDIFVSIDTFEWSVIRVASDIW